MTSLKPAPAPSGPMAPWRTPLPVPLAAIAVSTATEVAERLRAMGSAQALGTPVAPTQAGLESSAGAAVLHGQLDRLRPGHGWDHAAHAALADATRAIEGPWSAHPGLFGGLGGIAFTAHWLSQGGSRYQQLLAKADDAIVPIARARGEQLAKTPTGLPSRAYDAVAGLAGTAGYLLRRTENPAAVQSLRAVLAGLVVLTGEGPDGPNWFTPFDALVPESPMAKEFREGAYNLGLSHGIPGPVAVLSLAATAGISVPGQEVAIEQAVQWILNHRLDDEWGPNWPAAVPPSQQTRDLPYPAQSGWCYGTPGIARVLWLAGAALDDDKLRSMALQAMAAVYRRPWKVRIVGRSPGLCHGVGGLLQITLRFWNDTGDDLFAAEAIDLTERLLALYQPERPLGYFASEAGGELVDRPGLLDGAAGAALALLAAGSDREPGWDRLLLLA
ncbi:lanthionine synthetase C family protein [Fodinicola feengrottensis]|uniref:Lanthionine synthetase C family protein n=1 Tax=Fodinicola feengrottensis TaxID=435914 RepID=A0ABN2FVT5_9ACTN|nr:lanthionine synthetase C family protein [Fodinicola feengrottensis]